MMTRLWFSGHGGNEPDIWGKIHGNDGSGGKGIEEYWTPIAQFRRSDLRKCLWAMTANPRSQIRTLYLRLDDICRPRGSCQGRQEVGGKDFPQLLLSWIFAPSLWKVLAIQTKTLVGMAVVLGYWLNQREDKEKISGVRIRWAMGKWRSWASFGWMDTRWAWETDQQV